MAPGRKTGGRIKGISVNKNTQGFREKLAAFEGGKGFEPVQELLTLYTLIYADNPLVAVKILIALLDRMHPALKAVEHSGEIKNPYSGLPKEQLIKLAEEEIERMKIDEA